MKLLLFTPSLWCSAIGRVSLLLTDALTAMGVEVTIIKTEELSFANELKHDFHVPLYCWSDPIVNQLIHAADAVIYQIGNNFSFHRGCLEWLFVSPGFVCLHDFCLDNLFINWLRKNSHNKIQGESAFLTWYSPADYQRLIDYYQQTDRTTFIFEDAPLTEWICAEALGVITHSSWGIDRVLNSCPGPVRVMPLAYAKLDDGVEESTPKKSDKFTIVTTGQVNTNKRVDQIIRAIGNNALLRDNALFTIVGKIEVQYENYLMNLSQQLGVEIEILGEQPDPFYSEILCHADVVCCLRFPTVEAASATAIEAMRLGKPLLVINTGFYSEIPDECVRKISLDNEIENIESELLFVYSNSDAAIEMGSKAALWAKNTFCPDKYAAKLVEFILSTFTLYPQLIAAKIFSAGPSGYEHMIKHILKVSAAG